MILSKKESREMWENLIWEINMGNETLPEDVTKLRICGLRDQGGIMFKDASGKDISNNWVYNYKQVRAVPSEEEKVESAAYFKDHEVYIYILSRRKEGSDNILEVSTQNFKSGF